MNAFPSNKSAEQSANEPSMEDILASIRRIIADDKMLPLAPKAAPPEEPAASEADKPGVSRPPDSTPTGVAQHAAAPERATTFETPSLRVLQGGLPKSEPAITRESLHPPATEPVFDQPHRTESNEEASFEQASESLEAELASEPLMSADTDASVTSSFQTLAQTVFIQNTGMIEESLRSMLRPMLKQWLDQNLPPIVEKLVKTEIERVARGGR